MPEQALKDRTAIVGLGWTAFTARSGTTVANLAAEASLNAIADAGLAKRDVDGVVTYCFQTDTFDARQLAATLGLERCAFIVNERLGGGWACSAVATAAMAVHAGLCQSVLVFRAMNGRSERPALDPSRTQAVGPRQWTAPFGVYHAADTFGPYVTAHMARYGTTNLDLGHIAVTQRANAALNQKAMLRKPLTLEEHQQSPWLSYPFRVLDTCLTTDGAVALIVTSAARARDLRQVPVSIMAVMGGTLPAEQPWETNAVRAAPLLYAAGGITAQDVDLAELYDPFTGMCLLHLEGFGLAAPGEGATAYRAGTHGLDGRVPVNTHGGLLSEAYIHGLNHVVEAVQQLRPGGVCDDLCTGSHDFSRDRCRQVRDAEIALVCAEAGDSSLLLRRV
jgi:acetyl-CoA acetyltransferase